MNLTRGPGWEGGLKTASQLPTKTGKGPDKSREKSQRTKKNRELRNRTNIYLVSSAKSNLKKTWGPGFKNTEAVCLNKKTVKEKTHDS